MMKFLLILLFFLTFSFILTAQQDTIISISGDMLIGEIESMEKGILIFSTKYSDKDFNIEWDKISQVKTRRTFLIILSDGRRLNGSILSQPGDPPLVLISAKEGNLLIDKLLEITYLKPVERNFVGRLDALVELGYSYTRSKNHHQFQTRSQVGYTADYWGIDASLDIIRNFQDSVAPTRRTDANIGVRTFLKKAWYIALSNNFLQDDELKLKIRSTTNLSAGHLIINTHRSYWAAGAGFALNVETFTSEAPDEQSIEGLFSSELNLFAYEDLSLLTSLKIYPSITISRRIRTDFRFDIKYDLPLDFYIKLGFTHNFDNKPVQGAASISYIVQTSFGWEL